MLVLLCIHRGTSLQTRISKPVRGWWNRDSTWFVTVSIGVQILNPFRYPESLLALVLHPGESQDPSHCHWSQWEASRHLGWELLLLLLLHFMAFGPFVSTMVHIAYLGTKVSTITDTDPACHEPAAENRYFFRDQAGRGWSVPFKVLEISCSGEYQDQCWFAYPSHNMHVTHFASWLIK